MANRIWQVLLALLTRRYFWLLGGAAAAMTTVGLVDIFLLTGTDWASDFDAMAPTAAGFAIFMLAFLIVGPGKRPFAHPRSRLTPGFTFPHQVPVILLLLTATVLLPLMFAGGWSPQLPGLLAYCGCLTAALIWSLHRISLALLCVVGVAIYFSAVISAGQQFWGLQSGAAPAPIAQLLMVICWVATAAYPIRLARLTEEDADYAVPTDAIQFDFTARGERARWGLFGDPTKECTFGPWQPFDWWHDRIATLPQTGPARIAALRQYGFGPTPAWTGELLLIGFLTVFAVVAVNIEDFLGRALEIDDLPVSIFKMAGVFLVLPAANGYSQLAGRWPRLECELLRSQSRDDFVAGLHRAVAESLLQVNLITFTWWIAVWLLFAKSYIDPTQVLVGLLLVLAVQAFLLPLGILLAAVFRSMFGFMSTIVVAAFALYTPFTFWLDDRETLGDAPFVVAAVTLVALGAVLWRAAHRRWLQVEFGQFN